MLRFISVTHKTFDKVYEKMTAAFPYKERRDAIDQKECFNNPYFNFFEILDGDTPVGFVSPWIFENFIFIEHIAIDEDKRSMGYGSKALKLIKETYNKPIILEAEAPVSAQQIKRIDFYKRFGFSVNDYPYMQPSYHGGEGVPLIILSYPELLSPEDFDEFIKVTRENVYKQYFS